MAAPNFFDKVALAASHVIRGLSYQDLLSHLGQQKIVLAFDRKAAFSPEGKVTLELSINLLARLYPSICIAPIGEELLDICKLLTDIAQSINPQIDLMSEIEGSTAILCVGSTAIRQSSNVIYAGSNNWLAGVSWRHCIESGHSDNPFGAAAAACFGTANIFRFAFKESLPAPALDDFLLSVLTLEVEDLSNPPLSAINLDNAHLVGVGAIGNAAIWALARTPQLTGRLTLIDHDRIDFSNLQRYILTTQDTVGRSKIGIAAQALASTQLEVSLFEGMWEQYLEKHDSWRFHAVAVAVDSAEDRRAIQTSLPRWLVNGWTQPGNLGISRHVLDSEYPCLCCLYFPTGTTKNEDELIAEALGLPGDVREVRNRIQTNVPTDNEFIERVAKSLGISVEPLLPLVGTHIRRFYSAAACGGIILRLGATTHLPQAAEVPMAFQSALAGVLLASELVAYFGALKQAPPPVQTTLDLLRPLGQYLSTPVRKSPDCICRDRDYLERYRQKYK